MPYLSRFLLLLTALLAVASYAWANDTSDSMEPQSFYEQRLLDAVKEMNRLDVFASEKERDFSEVERRFRSVANLFNGIIANSPDAIEARLIYGKMLDRYGDREGARDQFIEVLRRDQTIAVAHQQLGTYYAEENDLTRALAYYLSAIEYAPDEPVYHFALGDLLYTFQSKMISDGLLLESVLRTKLFEAFGRAAQLAPENPIYQFRYGEAFDQLENPDWEKALAHWQSFEGWARLTKLQKQTIALHSARCLGEMGRYDEARTRLQEVDEAELEPLRSALAAAIIEAKASS